jgi:LPXTG-motif cell wall-anchored protein
MRKYFGASVVVLGIVLTVYGFKSSDSLNSRVTRLFNGGPTDGAMWLLVGGILVVMAGLALASFRRRSA